MSKEVNEPWSVGWRAERLVALYQDWEECTRCPLHKSRTNVVLGFGNPAADIMFIGEAPGEQEDQSGQPFVGASGELLFEHMWKAVGGSRDQVFTDNIVACRPPGNRDPNKEEKECCQSRLEQVIYLVDPLVIVPVGKFALTTLLKGRVWSIESERGKIFSSPSPYHWVTTEKHGLEIQGKLFPRKNNGVYNENREEYKKTHPLVYDAIPVYHPSFILRESKRDLRSGKIEGDEHVESMIQDLKKVYGLVQALKDHYERTTQLVESQMP